MPRGLGIGLLLGLAAVGFAFELASPLLLFPTEQIVLFTDPGESIPVIRTVPLGIPVPVDWQSTTQKDGRTKWVANLIGQLSEGIWQITTNEMSCTFLVVSPFFSIVEILAQSKSLVTLMISNGESFWGWADPPHPLTFLVQPICLGIEAWITVPTTNQNLFHCARIPLRPSCRVRLFLPSFHLVSTAKEALPGSTFVIGLSASGLAELLDFLLASENLVTFELPQGWGVEFITQDKCGNFSAGFVPWISVNVPPNAQLRTYRLGITIKNPKNTDFVCRLEGEVVVTDKLSPKEVIGHWNVAENKLDLSQPYGITYERLLWAISLVGQEIPYSGATLTRELLEELTKEWLSSSQ